MPTNPTPSAVLATLQGYDAWALVRMGDDDTVLAVGGARSEVASLLDVPLEHGTPDDGRTADRLLAIPFRQVSERGFEAHDDGTPLVVVDIDVEHHLPLEETLAAIADDGLEFLDRGGFESDDEEYAELVEAIIADEIGQGEGANLVIGRHYRARVAAWDAAKALTVFKRLCERERGAYWTFCFFTGDRYLIGASPERHVSVQGGFGTVSDVRMNPISGTFRLAGHDDPAERKEALLEFLADEKEIYELFMVVDEELKMMCDICHEGGQVLGPFLKPMTHLVHTEYLLAGRTRRDVREVLRDTMYAATVTGSPVQNACRLIKQYETEGRGYYGAALALIGRDREGRTRCDSPIVIRAADVDLGGRLKVTAGATLVRDSDPMSEVAETHAKAGGILSAFGLVGTPAAPAYGVDDLTRDEDVLIALNSRNQRLSTFWLTDQAGAPPDLRLAGLHVAILDGEDDFVNMLRHVLGVAGMTSEVVPHTRVRRRPPRLRRPGDRGAGPRRPARRRRRQDRDLPPRRRPAPGPRAAVPGGVSRPSGAVRPARDPLGLQGHRVPGHPGRGRSGRTSRARGLLQHVRRTGPDRRERRPRRTVRRERPGDRRRAPRARAALPRHPVPRRVDPHRARLRSRAPSGE